MMYESRATIVRVTALLGTGAAKERAKMLHAATKEVEAIMIAVDVRMEQTAFRSECTLRKWNE